MGEPSGEGRRLGLGTMCGKSLLGLINKGFALTKMLLGVSAVCSGPSMPSVYRSAGKATV